MGMTLEDGSKIGVIGGGPGGSMFAYFLYTFANRIGLDLEVDIFEPRDFTAPGPKGCNMCGGIVSESLVQALATEGINLPPEIVQRGLDSYVLHTDDSSVRIETPLNEMRIASLHRGGGPRDVEDMAWGGLDGFLLGLAQQLGAKVVNTRVMAVDWVDGKPSVTVGKDDKRTYDLLVGTVGVNSAGWKLFEGLGFQGERPKTTKAYITEVKLSQEAIAEHFGNSMHIFLFNHPRLDCTAIIPKGEYVTVCLLGTEIDKDLIEYFFSSPAVQRVFPPEMQVAQGACHCAPRINIKEASQPFLDRVVLVGDCGVTRLYKDGIGAAYRTAKAAARTAVFNGVSATDFEQNFMPTYRSIAKDNRYGVFVFKVVHWIKALGPVLRGVIRMAAGEQKKPGGQRRMSMVLWDSFTGSAPYRDVFFRTLDPRFWAKFLWQSILSITGSGKRTRVVEQRRSL